MKTKEVVGECRLSRSLKQGVFRGIGRGGGRGGQILYIFYIKC